MRRIRWLLGLAGVLGVLFWWGAVDNRMPGEAGFALDIGEVRRLASAQAGPRASALRFEKVGEFGFFHNMVVAGEGWSTVPMAIFAWQLEFPDRTVVIDSAMPAAALPPKFAVRSYDEAAQRRVEQALSQAALIAVTHEHSDHIAGVLMHPDFASLLPALRLTREQLLEPFRMRPAEPPPGLADYAPLDYERLHALAPGVVLIEAPGHTPGTQMVYVQLADARELLLLGDVAWHLENVERQRQRPRWVTGLLIREDRDAVFGQLKALHALAEAEPALRLVPGHDGAVVARLAAEGWLRPGFALRPPQAAADRVTAGRNSLPG